MASSNVGALTNRRKQNLNESGRGRNSMNTSGLKPSGPDYAGYDEGGSFVGSSTETWISLVGGAALTTYGVLELVNRKSRLVHGLLAVVGGGLLYRGVMGLLRPSDGMTESDTGMENPQASVQHLEGIKVEECVVINRSAQDLYDFWRDFANLPEIMHHLERVDVIDDNRSHWVAKAPLGTSVEWDAEVYIEKVGEMISWRSMDDGDIDTAGSVHFIPEGDGKTRVSVYMKVDLPAGTFGEAVASLFGEDPATQVQEDLENFKQQMEANTPTASPAVSTGVAGIHTTNGHSSNGKH
jgi:uncharacterized membrane protein